jgi:hypothetical protein
MYNQQQRIAHKNTRLTPLKPMPEPNHQTSLKTRQKPTPNHQNNSEPMPESTPNHQTRLKTRRKPTPNHQTPTTLYNKSTTTI